MGDAQIVQAMNTQTYAIIEAQQKASYDMAVHLAKFLKKKVDVGGVAVSFCICSCVQRTYSLSKENSIIS